MTHKSKSFFAIFASVLIILPVVAQAQAVDPNFNPNKLIDDKVFSDTKTFGGPAGIQTFLEAKGSPLANTSPGFLVKLKEPGITMLKQALDDPEPSLGRLRTAAELIWDASKSSGLNPQVIIVTLNKEEGLVTGQFNGDADLQSALDHAMGFACPDSGGCSDIFLGFYYQLFGNIDTSGNRYLGAAKSLMKSFSTPNGRGPANDSGSVAHVGDTLNIDNTQGPPYNAPASQAVTLLNNATAALYRYTPHVFNGNYNFWKYFNQWFRYPNGTLLALAGDASTYIIQNGTKQLVPTFVAIARGLNVDAKTTASPTEFDSYPTGQPLSPVDNTIAKDSAGKYVFENGVKHLASDFVIKQRGLDPDLALTMTDADSALYTTGSVLPPKDGTIIRGQQNKAVYLVDSGEIKMFSAVTFAQRKVSTKQITLVPDAEIATYTQNGFVSPLDGTLVKSPSNTAVYLVESGLKQPLTADLFKNNGYSYKNIVTLSADEVTSLPEGSYATPKDRTFFASGDKTGPLYEFKEGTKHVISTFVAKQRGITPDYVFSGDMTSEWADGAPIPPRDGTIVKGDSATDQTVYLVSGGQLRPLTYQAYKNRGITAKKTTVLPQAEVDAYAKGDTLAK